MACQVSVVLISGCLWSTAVSRLFLMNPLSPRCLFDASFATLLLISLINYYTLSIKNRGVIYQKAKQTIEFRGYIRNTQSLLVTPHYSVCMAQLLKGCSQIDVWFRNRHC
jgi:hypothetical protein